MVGRIAAFSLEALSRLPAAAAASNAAAQPDPTPAPAAQPQAARHSANAASFASGALSALLHAQEQAGQNGHGGAGEALDRVHDALEGLFDRLRRRHGGEPTDPPAPAPEPAPAPQPTMATDDPAPAQHLAEVLAEIHEPLQSQYPSTPFSERYKPVAAVQPSPAPQGGVFYTPGSFTPSQAHTMQTVVQAQAGLALLQAAQTSLYGASTAPAAGLLGAGRLI